MASIYCKHFQIDLVPLVISEIILAIKLFKRFKAGCKHTLWSRQMPAFYDKLYPQKFTQLLLPLNSSLVLVLTRMEINKAINIKISRNAILISIVLLFLELRYYLSLRYFV